MYSLEILITVGIATLLVGGVAGAAIAQRSGSAPQSRRKLENQLEQMQQQAQEYRNEVSTHFVETAELLNQLTTSYRNVHEHLARGAQELAGDSGAQYTLKRLSEAGGDDKGPSAPLTPPLDYAPNSDTDESGILQEEYGLEKSANARRESLAAQEDRL